jgi:hypothetical protein
MNLPAVSFGIQAEKAKLIDPIFAIDVQRDVKGIFVHRGGGGTMLIAQIHHHLNPGG